MSVPPTEIGGDICLAEEKETNSQQTTIAEEKPEVKEEPVEGVANQETPKPDEPVADDTTAKPEGETEAKAEDKTESVQEAATEPADETTGSTTDDEKPKDEDSGGKDERDAPKHDQRRRDSHRGGGRGGRRGDRPLTNEDKLRMYKKQSEERLLDIKRSREAKVGKKKR